MIKAKLWSDNRRPNPIQFKLNMLNTLNLKVNFSSKIYFWFKNVSKSFVWRLWKLIFDFDPKNYLSVFFFEWLNYENHEQTTRVRAFLVSFRYYVSISSLYIKHLFLSPKLCGTNWNINFSLCVSISHNITQSYHLCYSISCFDQPDEGTKTRTTCIVSNLSCSYPQWNVLCYFSKINAKFFMHDRMIYRNCFNLIRLVG